MFELMVAFQKNNTRLQNTFLQFEEFVQLESVILELSSNKMQRQTAKYIYRVKNAVQHF